LNILIFGGYNQVTVKNYLNTYGVGTSSGVLSTKYDNMFFNFTKINRSDFYKNSFIFTSKNYYLSLLTKIVSTSLIISALLFLTLYTIIIISYKYNFMLPGFVTFSLINLTVLIFSLVNSGTDLETLLNNFIFSVAKVNYNNLDSIKTNLSYQEKYFSKYENTYFTDKKCGED